jgi:molybdopterin biosynthesis enzyme MoaB
MAVLSLSELEGTPTTAAASRAAAAVTASRAVFTFPGSVSRQRQRKGIRSAWPIAAHTTAVALRVD